MGRIPELVNEVGSWRGFLKASTRRVVCYSEVEKQYTAACHNRYNHKQPHDIEPSVPESDLRPYIKHSLPIPVSCFR